MRLILRLLEDELHGADDAVGVLGREQRNFTLRHAMGRAPPEVLCLRRRQGVHEAHRRAAVHAIDQQFGESPNLRLGDGMQALNGVPIDR